MWTFLFSLFGFLLGIILFFIAGSQRFLLDNDLLGLGPFLYFSVFTICGMLAGAVFGLWMDISSAKKNGGRTINGFIRAAIGIFVFVTLGLSAFGPIPLFNPFKTAIIVAIEPLRQFKLKRAEAKAIEEIKKNPMLTMGPARSGAGLGLKDEIHTFAQDDEDHIFILGDIERGITFGNIKLGPCMRLSKLGEVDLIFSKNLMLALSSVLGITMPGESSSITFPRDQLSHLLTLKDGSRIFSARDQIFSVNSDGTLKKKFSPQESLIATKNIPSKEIDGVRRGEAIFAQDGESVFISYGLGEYSKPPVGSELISKYRLDGSKDLSFHYDHGFKDMTELHIAASHLNIFQNGNLFFLRKGESRHKDGSIDHFGRMIIVSPTGETVWEEDAPYYIPMTKVQPIGKDRLMVTLFEESKPHKETVRFILANGSVPSFKLNETTESQEISRVVNLGSPSFWGQVSFWSQNNQVTPQVEVETGRIHSYWDQSDGSRIVGGQFFVKQDGSAFVNIARILPGGRLDPDFLKLK